MPDMIAMRNILTTFVPSLADTKKNGSLCLAAKLKDLDVTYTGKVNQLAGWLRAYTTSKQPAARLVTL